MKSSGEAEKQMEFNTATESQMKESNQMLTKEKYLNKVGKQQPV